MSNNESIFRCINLVSGQQKLIFVSNRIEQTQALYRLLPRDRSRFSTEKTWMKSWAWKGKDDTDTSSSHQLASYRSLRIYYSFWYFFFALLLSFTIHLCSGGKRSLSQWQRLTGEEKKTLKYKKPVYCHHPPKCWMTTRLIISGLRLRHPQTAVYAATRRQVTMLTTSPNSFNRLNSHTSHAFHITLKRVFSLLRAYRCCWWFWNHRGGWLSVR